MKTKFRIPVKLFLAAMLCTVVVFSCKDDDEATPPPDLTALKASIQAANDKLTTTTEGRADGEYSTESRTTLQAAIASAQAVVDNAETTQEQADGAKASLDAAVTAYGNAVIKPVAPEALIAWWSFDEGTGTVAGDMSSNNFDGEFKAGPIAPDWESNLPTWSTDRTGAEGKALNFNGGSVEIPYNAAFNPSDAITIAVWVKQDVVKAKNRFLGLHSWVGYKYELQDVAYPFFSWGYDGGTIDKDAGVAVPKDEWHHIAVTYSATDAQMIFYIDGVVASTIGDLGQTGHSIAENPYNLVIGQDFPSDKYCTCNGDNFGDSTSDEYQVIPAAWGGYFEGSLDELRMYNIALSADQVKGIYDREKPDAE